MIYESIRNCARAGIFTHINPDGDALGSCLGLCGCLESLGKDYILFLPTAPGESLQFMIPDEVRCRTRIWDEAASESIKAEIEGCDLLVGMDFNTLSRIDRYAGPFCMSKGTKILIDHHIAPQEEVFDKVYSRTDISSASELLFYILMDDPDIKGDASKLSPVSRNALMTGMTTDTNNFANSVYPSTLRMAAALMQAGVDRDAIIQHLYFSYPERRLRAQGHVLSDLMKITEQGAAYIFLDRNAVEQFHLGEGDTEGFVNMPLSINNVCLSILAKEEKEPSRKIRISIRSKKGTSARNLAMESFHGGGHELASGGRLTVGEDVESAENVPEYIEKSLQKFFLER